MLDAAPPRSILNPAWPPVRETSLSVTPWMDMAAAALEDSSWQDAMVASPLLRVVVVVVVVVVVSMLVLGLTVVVRTMATATATALAEGECEWGGDA